MSLDYGRVSVVGRAWGLSRKAISKGIRELQARGKPLVGRAQRPGADRKSITQSDPRQMQTLVEGLISEVIGPVSQIAPKKLWCLALWQGEMWRRGRPM